jgi:hypothetical protein
MREIAIPLVIGRGRQRFDILASVRLRHFSALGGVTAVCLWALTAPVSAQTSPGVHVDPGSPADSEYAVPIQAARGDFDKPDNPTRQTTRSSRPSRSSGSSGSSQSSQSSRSSEAQRAPAPFGAGITTARAKARRAARTRTRAPQPDVTRPVKVAAAPRLRDVDADSSVSPALVTGGIVAGMLLIALAVVAITRQPRRTSS